MSTLLDALRNRSHMDHELAHLHDELIGAWVEFRTMGGRIRCGRVKWVVAWPGQLTHICISSGPEDHGKITKGLKRILTINGQSTRSGDYYGLKKTRN
jgi:hypothetical protein